MVANLFVLFYYFELKIEIHKFYNPYWIACNLFRFFFALSKKQFGISFNDLGVCENDMKNSQLHELIAVVRQSFEILWLVFINDEIKEKADNYLLERM